MDGRRPTIDPRPLPTLQKDLTKQLLSQLLLQPSRIDRKHRGVLFIERGRWILRHQRLPMLRLVLLIRSEKDKLGGRPIAYDPSSLEVLDGPVRVVLVKRAIAQDRLDIGPIEKSEGVGGGVDERFVGVEGEEDGERVQEMLGEKIGGVSLEAQAIQGRGAGVEVDNVFAHWEHRTKGLVSEEVL